MDELFHKLVDFIVGKELLAIGDEKNLKRLHKELVGKDWFMALLDLKAYGLLQTATKTSVAVFPEPAITKQINLILKLLLNNI